jgi:uncharacterized cupin superfamily protein
MTANAVAGPILPGMGREDEAIPEPALRPNMFGPRWDAERQESSGRWRRAFLGRQAGAEALGASLFELEPGATTFPFHVHHANEELLVVIAGQPILRTGAGERRLEEGEVVAFPVGRDGAHALRNSEDGPVRLLLVSTMRAPDVTEFPDSGELWVRDYPPGSKAPDGALDKRLPLGEQRENRS